MLFSYLSFRPLPLDPCIFFPIPTSALTHELCPFPCDPSLAPDPVSLSRSRWPDGGRANGTAGAVRASTTGFLEELSPQPLTPHLPHQVGMTLLPLPCSREEGGTWWPWEWWWPSCPMMARIDPHHPLSLHSASSSTSLYGRLGSPSPPQTEARRRAGGSFVERCQELVRSGPEPRRPPTPAPRPSAGLGAPLAPPKMKLNETSF